MGAGVKEFIDFWMQNSVHARLDLGQEGSSQSSDELVRRFLLAAKEQGISEGKIRAEIGDPVEFVKAKLSEENAAESGRRHSEA